MPQNEQGSGIRYQYNADVKALFTTDLKMRDWPWEGSPGYKCEWPRKGITVQFTDQSIGNAGYAIDKWYWDFGDDHFSRDQNPTHTFYGPIKVKLWVWNHLQATEKQHVWSDWDQAGNDLSFGFTSIPGMWNAYWAVVKGGYTQGSGMTVYRKAKVSPTSASKEVTIAHCKLPQDLTGYGSDTDTYLTLLQTDEYFNNVTHWDYTGNAPAAGMTVSIVDSGLQRINHNLRQHRDYALTEILGQYGKCFGDVGNQGHHPGREVTTITFMDWWEEPYKDFETMMIPVGDCSDDPIWIQAWPAGLGNATGYKIDAFQTFEVVTFTGTDWAWIEHDFDTVFDFVGVPRSGVDSVAVQFTDLSVLEISEWDWDFGDGTVKGVTAGSTHQHPLHTYTYD